MSYYITFDSSGGLALAHYGILGQKWGIRRFQNPDGTLTSEGRKRAKAEYKADNKKAFELGKKATVTGKALKRATKKLEKANYKNVAKRSAVFKKFQKDYDDLMSEIQAHHAELQEKYGKDAIKDIKYGKNGLINERILTGKQIAGIAAAVPLASVAAFIPGGKAAAVLYMSSLVHLPFTTYGATVMTGAIGSSVLAGSAAASRGVFNANSKAAKEYSQANRSAEHNAKQNFKAYGYEAGTNLYEEDPRRRRK